MCVSILTTDHGIGENTDNIIKYVFFTIDFRFLGDNKALSRIG